MSGTTIGEVNINLRMSLAQFKQDTKDGTAEASRSTKKMAEEMSANTQEAKATLALLGEEIGVTIPRHIRGLIANLPGVGTALSAAFNSVAVLAMIEVVAKIVEKIAEFRKKAEEAAEAMKKSGEVAPEAIFKINESILSLDAQLAELNGNYLQALLDKLKLIDAQNLDDLVGEFEKVQKAADEALDKFQVNFFDNLLSFGKDSGRVQGIKKDLDGTVESVKQLKNAGASAADIGDLLAAAMGRVNLQLEHSKGLHESVIQALQFEKSKIEDMQREYDALNAKAAKQKDLERGRENKADQQRLIEEGRAYDELNKKVAALLQATQVLLNGELDAQDQKIKKVEDEIRAWQDLAAEQARIHPGIKTYYDEEIKALQQKLALLQQEKAANEALLARGVIPGVTPKAPDFSKDKSVTPIYGGSSAQLTLEKIKTDSATAQAELTKVVDATQDINTKFQEQSAILDQLHKQYPEVFNEEMLKKAKAAIDPVAKAWRDFGQDIGDTIKQALLFGRGWTDALKSIALELVQVILKLTLMKTLSAGGGGGFFGSILGGLFGGFKASGGPVTAGTAYVVGEQGPELFVPGASGNIIPNGGGGPHVTNYYDARGADVAAIQRLERLIERNKFESVAMSVAAVRDQRRRS